MPQKQTCVMQSQMTPKMALEWCASDLGLFSFRNSTTGGKNDDANQFLRLYHGLKKVPKGNTSTKWRQHITTWCEYHQTLRFENQVMFMCRWHVLDRSVACLQHVLSCGFFFTPKDMSQKTFSTKLGFSEQHSTLVANVCHLPTGFVSPQNHCVFDDIFATVYGVN